MKELSQLIFSHVQLLGAEPSLNVLSEIPAV